MIPYFQWEVFSVGPVPIRVWGFFVALGLAVATTVGWREAKRRRLDANAFVDMAAWAALAGIIGARIFYVVFYDPLTFLAQPLEFFRLWDGGLSVFGGFFGGAAALALFLRWRRLPFRPYADLAAYVLPLGCGFGRLGCFLIHDHPGVLSGFFLAVAYPGGGRLDHGLLLSLLNFAIFGLFFALNRRPGGASRPYLAWYLVIYGAARFWLDFLRAWDLPMSDVRFMSLTPAQYFSLLLLVAGVFLLCRRSRSKLPSGA